MASLISGIKGMELDQYEYYEILEDGNGSQIHFYKLMAMMGKGKPKTFPYVNGVKPSVLANAKECEITTTQQFITKNYMTISGPGETEGKKMIARVIAGNINDIKGMKE